MTITTGNQPFTTTDTAIAAYLISEGLPYPSIQHTDDNECVFCFPATENPAEYERLETNYRLHIATGNIAIFFTAYKKLLKQLHKR